MYLKLILSVAALLATSPARAESCGGLYARRNGVYKDAGYCFKTPRAVRMFGNVDCQYDDVNAVPLSVRQRKEVALIKDKERFRGCAE